MTSFTLLSTSLSQYGNPKNIQDQILMPFDEENFLQEQPWYENFQDDLVNEILEINSSHQEEKQNEPREKVIEHDTFSSQKKRLFKNRIDTDDVDPEKRKCKENCYKKISSHGMKFIRKKLNEALNVYEEKHLKHLKIFEFQPLPSLAFITKMSIEFKKMTLKMRLYEIYNYQWMVPNSYNVYPSNFTKSDIENYKKQKTFKDY
jgi:hypothetical protein